MTLRNDKKTEGQSTVTKDSKKLDRALKQSANSDPVKRVEVLDILQTIDHPMAVNIMIGSLLDKDSTARWVAAMHLGSMEDKRAIPHLLKALGDRYWEVRMRALESLGQLWEKPSSPRQIALMLSDPDELVRVTAAEVLAEIGCARDLPKFRKTLRDSKGLVRGYVAEAIGSIGGDKEVNLLKKHLASERSVRARFGFFTAL